MPKIRNILIFIAIIAVLVLIYVFFIKPSSSDQASLVSTPAGTMPTSAGAMNANGTSLGTQDFLTLLLNVKSIKLDDSIFSDPAFLGLHDSSITLVPDTIIGRPNPFAQFGATPAAAPTATPIPATTTTPITPVVPKTPAKP